jgi:hypothetical protein
MSCLEVRAAPNDWLAGRRAASLYVVVSDAGPDGSWRCCGPRWLASVVVGSHIFIYVCVIKLLQFFFVSVNLLKGHRTWDLPRM